MLDPVPVAELIRKAGITEQTYYRWRKEYGGLKADQAKRLKELEQEIAARTEEPRRKSDDKAQYSKHWLKITRE